jgi:hypothetical protein
MSYCQSISQQAAAMWIGQHPAWTIKKLSCMTPEDMQVAMGRGRA